MQSIIFAFLSGIVLILYSRRKNMEENIISYLERKGLFFLRLYFLPFITLRFISERKFEVNYRRTRRLEINI